MPSAAKALCDSGPLVALFDSKDTEHDRCRAALDAFNGRLMTTWPVLTEVFHFLNAPQQRLLWNFVLAGGVVILDVLSSDLQRLHTLMLKYSDLPMDLADGSLVVVAERLGVRSVFTLDDHFRVYRPSHAHGFMVAP